MRDAFRTIAGPASARITRKRSRFLSFARPVESNAEVSEALAALRKTYHDASHVCSAYRLSGDSEAVSGSDDDGEPSGSAGEPILRRIEGAGLEDVLVAVVRYFGGVKLGIGGLIRAYSEAAEQALAAASSVIRKMEATVRVDFPPEATSGVMGTIHRCNATVKHIEYDAAGLAVVTLPPSRVKAFLTALREATSAKAQASVEAGNTSHTAEMEVQE